MMKKIKKRYIVVALLFLFTVGGHVLMTNRRNKNLSAQESLINELSSKISVRKKTKEEATIKEYETAIGIDMNRINKDKEIAEKFMDKAMSWASYEEYTKLRNEFKTEYQLDDKNGFLKTFFPEVPNKVAPNGQNYNKIDTEGLSAVYDDMKLYNISVKGTTYSYLAFVDWHTTNKDNGATGSSTEIFMFDVDIDGKIQNLYGYTTTK